MDLSKKDWAEIENAFSPDQISTYVERGLERMYFGTAPTLGYINTEYGKEKFEGLIAKLIDEIFKFAGLKDTFPEDVMVTLAHTVRTEYPWLKITELMHFVYLFRLGNFDNFYGKPTAASLMKMLRQYIKVDREKLKAEVLARREKEEKIIEMTRQHQESSAAMALLVADEIAKAFSEEAYEKARWRYQPYGTAMARAYFIDKTLAKFPGDMEERERMKWAKDNAAYVKMHPNFNIVA